MRSTPEDQLLVSIVIVNWNTRDLLIQTLQSLYDSMHGPWHEIIVVDNASSDGSAEKVRQEFPDTVLIESGINVGFAAGNNLAIRRSRGKFLLLLNPDTIVPAGAVTTLLQFMEDHTDIGIAAPKLLSASGTVQISSFGLFPSPLEAVLHAVRIWRLAPGSRLARRFLAVPAPPNTWCYAAHVLGAAMLIRREVITQIVGFDEGFFLFLEETDLCYRAQSAGWRIAYTTTSTITHFGEQSMQKILHKAGGLYVRSYNRFCNKYRMGPLSLVATNLFLIMGILVEAIIGVVKHRSSNRVFHAMQALYYAYVRQPRC
jgi:GT2 family glycosyltransferase